MHCNHLSGRIYVKKTSEQCYLGYYNSQETRGGVSWDRYSSKGLDDQQVEGEDDPKGDI